MTFNDFSNFTSNSLLHITIGLYAYYLMIFDYTQCSTRILEVMYTCGEFYYA